MKKDTDKPEMTLKLLLKGKPPKYLKVYVNKDNSAGDVFKSNDKKEFIKTNIQFTFLYEYLYRHINGSDTEMWMLFELKDKEHYQKYLHGTNSNK